MGTNARFQSVQLEGHPHSINRSFTAQQFGTKPSIAELINDPYKFEKRRFESFPREIDDEMAEICARNGFYYIRAMKKIQCYSCGLRIKIPEEKSEGGLIAFHRSQARNDCPFLCGQAGNVALPREILEPSHENEESHSEFPVILLSSSPSSSSSSNNSGEPSEPMILGGESCDNDISGRTASTSSSPSSSSSILNSSGGSNSDYHNDRDNNISSSLGGEEIRRPRKSQPSLRNICPEETEAHNVTPVSNGSCFPEVRTTRMGHSVQP